MEILEAFDERTSKKIEVDIIKKSLLDRSISKNNKIRISYKCVGCDKGVIISYNRFLEKYLKGKFLCSLCLKNTSLEDELRDSDERWEKYNNKYYYISQLTEDEFEDLRNKIVKIDRETSIEDLIFYPTFWDKDKKYFTPLIFNIVKNVYWIPKSVYIRCDCCSGEYKQSWAYLKNKRFLYCPKCIQKADSRKI